MAFNNHTTTSQDYRLLPPPIRPGDQTTAFAVGDMLLIDLSFWGLRRTSQAVVTVEKVTVTHYPVRENLTYTSVLYGLRHQDKPCYTVMTECDLKRWFMNFVWVR